MSNSQLVFYQLLMADMFEKDAAVDAPLTAQHARFLSSGFLAASALTQAEDYDKRNQSMLHRGLADASTMSCLTCILFHNLKDDYQLISPDTDKPHSKRQWEIGKEHFLRGLLKCAGRRHALGIEDSGCMSVRSAGKKRSRPAGFADWDIVDEDEMMDLEDVDASRSRTQLGRRGNQANIDDFRDALRPMIVYYAMMDQLSKDFIFSMDDIHVEEVAGRLVEVIEGCQRCKNIHELLRRAEIKLDHDQIIDELQRGMIAA